MNSTNLSHTQILFVLLGISVLGVVFFYSGIETKDSSYASALTGNARGIPGNTGLPSCIKDWEQEPMLNGVVAYLKDSRNSNVIRAWNPCQNVPEILQRIKRGLIDAETRRINENIKELPDAPLPETWDTASTGTANYVNCGSSAPEIIAMKIVAHILVDYWDLVPWNLWDYGSEDLERLFGDAAEYGFCNYYNVLDHSPREAWAILASQYDIASIKTPTELVETIMKSTRSFRHGGVWVYSNGTIFKQDNQGIVTMKQMWEEKVSRHGCWSMTAYFGQLASNFNVPGYRTTNQYAETGHATEIFEQTGQVLAHGDDPYNALYDDTPALKVFNDYSFWKREVVKKNPTTTSYQKSQLHEYEMGRTYPSHYLMYDYCHPSSTNSGKSFPTGRDYLRYISTYKGYSYWTEVQMDELETTIQSKTQNCAVIPADDPEH